MVLTAYGTAQNTSYSATVCGLVLLRTLCRNCRGEENRDLVRKEKALAEAAALLILQKKVPRAAGGRGQDIASESTFYPAPWR